MWYCDQNLQHNEKIPQQLPQHVCYSTVLKKMSLWFYRGENTEKLYINLDNHPISMIVKRDRDEALQMPPKTVTCVKLQQCLSAMSNLKRSVGATRLL